MLLDRLVDPFPGHGGVGDNGPRLVAGRCPARHRPEGDGVCAAGGQVVDEHAAVLPSRVRPTGQPPLSRASSRLRRLDGHP